MLGTSERVPISSSLSVCSTISGSFTLLFASSTAFDLFLRSTFDLFSLSSSFASWHEWFMVVDVRLTSFRSFKMEVGCERMSKILLVGFFAVPCGPSRLKPTLCLCWMAFDARQLLQNCPRSCAQLVLKTFPHQTD